MTEPYESPFGQPAGLHERLAWWVHRLGTDRSLPWPGLGLIRDLELAVQLLNVTEFAEWLRTNGTPEQARFADEILANEFTLASVRTAVDVAGYNHVSDPVKAVELLDEENRANEAGANEGQLVRQVLAELGVLASANDKSVPLPDLLRVLLA